MGDEMRQILEDLKSLNNNNSFIYAMDNEIDDALSKILDEKNNRHLMHQTSVSTLLADLKQTRDVEYDELEDLMVELGIDTEKEKRNEKDTLNTLSLGQTTDEIQHLIVEATQILEEKKELQTYQSQNEERLSLSHVSNTQDQPPSSENRLHEQLQTTDEKTHDVDCDDNDESGSKNRVVKQHQTITADTQNRNTNRCSNAENEDEEEDQKQQRQDKRKKREHHHKSRSASKSRERKLKLEKDATNQFASSSSDDSKRTKMNNEKKERSEKKESEGITLSSSIDGGSKKETRKKKKSVEGTEISNDSLPLKEQALEESKEEVGEKKPKRRKRNRQKNSTDISASKNDEHDDDDDHFTPNPNNQKELTDDLKNNSKLETTNNNNEEVIDASEVLSEPEEAITNIKEKAKRQRRLSSLLRSHQNLKVPKKIKKEESTTTSSVPKSFSNFKLKSHNFMKILSNPKVTIEEKEEVSAEKHRTSIITLQEMALKVHNLKEVTRQKALQVSNLKEKLSSECDQLSDDEKAQMKLEITRLEKEIFRDDLLVGSLELTIETYLRKSENNDNSVGNSALEIIEDTLKSSSDTPHQSRKFIIVNSFQELPVEYQSTLKGLDLPQEIFSSNFELLLKIINFMDHTRYITDVEHQKYLISKNNQPRPPAYGRITKPFSYYVANSQNIQPSKLYRPIKHEGHGGFGRVYYAQDKKKKQKVAIKKLTCDTPKRQRDCANEVGFLQFCKHPNIVGFIDFVQDERTSWIIMEFLDGGTVLQTLEVTRITELNMSFIISEVLLGLKYLHNNNILHRDIKSANIMLNMIGEVKIIDLGLCIDLTEIQFLRHKCAGTCEFIAPELFEGVNVGPWCDIWSLGITLLEMANGEPPISSALKSMILASSNHFGSARSLLKNPDDWSKEFISFIEQCLIFDYSKRPTAESLLQHPWIIDGKANCDIDDIANLVRLSWTKQYAPF